MVIMVYTPTHGRKWWLLRNGRTLCGEGILLLFFLPVLCIYFMIVVSFSFFVWAALVILFIVDILWIKHTSCYRTLYCLTEELRCTLEDFDPLRLILKVTKGTRSYFILFYPYMSFYMWIAMTRLGSIWNLPSRHYQVWTPLKGFVSCHTGSLWLYGICSTVRYWEAFPLYTECSEKRSCV